MVRPLSRGGCPGGGGPNFWIKICSTRSRISPAALLVNVTARMFQGATPASSIRWAIRRVSTRVLPEPGPASTNTGPLTVVTALICSWLSCANGLVIIFPLFFAMQQAQVAFVALLGDVAALDRGAHGAVGFMVVG